MAMTAQTWSISGLATELQIDRRTLAKKLDRLRPAEERDVGGRIEKRWRLADVLPHLARASASPASGEMSAAEVELDHDLKNFATQFLFPRVVESRQFHILLIRHCHEDLGLSKAASLDVSAMATLGLMGAISETFGEQDMDFNVDESAWYMRWGQAKKDGKTAAFVAEHWPDKVASRKKTA